MCDPSSTCLLLQLPPPDQEHSYQEIKSSTMCMGQANNQLIETRHSHAVEDCITLTSEKMNLPLTI